jgi:hypothetical protein
MVGCCVFRPLQPLSSLLHGLSSRCAIASRSAILAPLFMLVVASPLQMPPPPIPASPPLIPPSPLVAPWPPVTLVRLVVALPLLPPPPPICRRLRLSSRHRLSLHHGLPYFLSGWLSCRLRRSSSRRAPPAGCCVASTAHPLGTPLPLNAPLPLDAQHPHPTSRSPFAAASDLPAPPPLILPMPLVAPWPHVPLEPLVVALSQLTPLPPICRCLRLSLRRRLSLRHGLPYLLSGWLLRRLRGSYSRRAPLRLFVRLELIIVQAGDITHVCKSVCVFLWLWDGGK